MYAGVGVLGIRIWIENTVRMPPQNPADNSALTGTQ